MLSISPGFICRILADNANVNYVRLSCVDYTGKLIEELGYIYVVKAAVDAWVAKTNKKNSLLDRPRCVREYELHVHLFLLCRAVGLPVTRENTNLCLDTHTQKITNYTNIHTITDPPTHAHYSYSPHLPLYSATGGESEAVQPLQVRHNFRSRGNPVLLGGFLATSTKCLGARTFEVYIC